MERARLRTVAALLAVLAPVAAACSSQEGGSAGADDDESASTTLAPALELETVDLSGEGFTLDVPTSWNLVDDIVERDLADAVDALDIVPGFTAAQIEQLIQSGLVLIAAEDVSGSPRFAPNLNVLSLPRGTETSASMLENTETQLARVGDVNEAGIRPHEVGEVVYVSYELRSGATTVHGEQFTFLSETDVYVVTASTDDLPTHLTTFTAVGESFRFAGDAVPLAPTTPTTEPADEPETTTTSTTTTASPTTTTEEVGEILFTHRGPGPSATFELPTAARVRYDADDNCSFMLETSGGLGIFVSGVERGFVRLVVEGPQAGPVSVGEIIGCDDGALDFYAEPPSAAGPVDPDGDGVHYVVTGGASTPDFTLPAGAVASWDGDGVCSVTLREPGAGVFDDVGFFRLGEAAGPLDLGITEELVVYVSDIIGCRDGDVAFTDPG